MRKRQTINKEIKAISKLFKDNSDTFSRDESDKIRRRLYRKAMTYDFLKSKLELTDDEKRVFKRIPRYLKKLNTNLSKRDKYRKNYLYGLEQLYGEDLYYKPFEVKSAFNGNYVLYESNGDEIRSLNALEYLLKIKPHLYDLIEEYGHNDT